MLASSKCVVSKFMAILVLPCPVFNTDADDGSLDNKGKILINFSSGVNSCRRFGKTRDGKIL